MNCAGQSCWTNVWPEGHLAEKFPGPTLGQDGFRQAGWGPRLFKNNKMGPQNKNWLRLSPIKEKFRRRF